MVYTRDGEQYEYDTEVRNDEVAGHPVRMTSYHTVVDSKWSVNYILDVQEAEREAGHEICGAEKKNGFPCAKYPLRPDEELYPSEIGRCEIHRPSMVITSEMVVSGDASLDAIMVPPPSLSPTARMIMNIADNLYLGCGNCNKRKMC